MENSLPAEIEQIIEQSAENAVDKVMKSIKAKEKTSRKKIPAEQRIVEIFALYDNLKRSSGLQSQRIVKIIDESIDAFPVLRMIYFEGLDRKQVEKRLKINSSDLKCRESEELKQISELILK